MLLGSKFPRIIYIISLISLKKRHDCPDPLVSRKYDKLKIYYSFWLLNKLHNTEQKEALSAFQEQLSLAHKVKFKLQQNDILVIDNGRILHGRTAIVDDSRRFLKRYWIQKPITIKNQLDNKETNTMGSFILPEKITQEHIEFFKSKGIDKNVAELDLSMVKMKLQDPTEGKGWTKEQCDDAEIEYKRFLTLNLLYPQSIVPTIIMDTFWHYHILDTRAYHRDSQKVFGEYFHHFPYFGMRGEEDRKNLDASFEETKNLYEKTFGESIWKEGESKCWHDCSGRCWHACSNDDITG